MISNSISIIYDTIELPDVKPIFVADLEAGAGRPQGLVRLGLRQCQESTSKWEPSAS